MSAEREQVIRMADRVREDLVLTLRELDRRKTDALDLHHYLERARPYLPWVGGAVAVLAGASVTASIFNHRHHRRRLPRARWLAARRAWEHPDRLASRAKDRPLFVELFRRVALAALTTVAISGVKRALQPVLPENLAAD